MKLGTVLFLYASSIGDSARLVFHKKTGKGRGLDKIKDGITKIAKENARSVGGDISDKDLNEFLGTRMGYMRDAFTQLNNPKTDTSVSRAGLIDRTESDAAEWFGKTKGHESQGERYKAWVDLDGCDDCLENSDEGPIPIGDEFPSGDYAPPAHPNCTCYLEFMSDLEDEDG